MPADENVSEESEIVATDQPGPIEIVEVDIVETDVVEQAPRDQLSIAIVAGLAALLLICVIFIFIANGHRPAGL